VVVQEFLVISAVMGIAYSEESCYLLFFICFSVVSRAASLLLLVGLVKVYGEDLCYFLRDSICNYNQSTPG